MSGGVGGQRRPPAAAPYLDLILESRLKAGQGEEIVPRGHEKVEFRS